MKNKFSGTTTEYFHNLLQKSAQAVPIVDKTNKSQIHTFLQKVLGEPLAFNNGYMMPIWWFRGGSSIFIRNFEILSPALCIIDKMECDIALLEYYIDPAKTHDFIYIELNPQSPTGLYPKGTGSVQQSLGYDFEEYFTLNDKQYTRSEYDYNEVDSPSGPIDISDAKERKRFLTKYNFLIASQYSPLNDSIAEKYLQILLNQILKGQSTYADLLQFIQKLAPNQFNKRW